MELLLYSILLYVLQCLVTLPANGYAWIPLLGGCFTIRGPGFAILSPWPGSRTLAGGGYPFDLGDGRVYTESPKGFFRGGALVPDSRSCPLGEAETWSVRGSHVLWRDKGLFQTVSKAHASHLAALFSKLAGSAPASRDGIVNAELDAAFDVAECRQEFLEGRRHTRLLRWTCNIYALAVFVLLPALIVLWDGETAWWTLLPSILVLHSIGIVALWWASRKFGESAGDRFERVFVAALYPPALLRSSIDLMSDRLARFHPLTAASLVLRRPDLRRHLQVVSGELTHPVWRRHELYEVPGEVERMAFLARVRERIEALAREMEIDLRPSLRDASAASYCPLCLFDYRPGFDACMACGISTEPYIEDHPTGDQVKSVT